LHIDSSRAEEVSLARNRMVVLVLAVTAALAGLAGPAKAVTGWHAVATPQPCTDSASQTRDLYSVVALSPSNVWAGGRYIDLATGHSVMLMLHGADSGWHRASLPPPAPGCRASWP
jgi:hypothetical protein